MIGLSDSQKVRSYWTGLRSGIAGSQSGELHAVVAIPEATILNGLEVDHVSRIALALQLLLDYLHDAVA